MTIFWSYIFFRDLYIIRRPLPCVDSKPCYRPDPYYLVSHSPLKIHLSVSVGGGINDESTKICSSPIPGSSKCSVIIPPSARSASLHPSSRLIIANLTIPGFSSMLVPLSTFRADEAHMFKFGSDPLMVRFVRPAHDTRAPPTQPYRGPGNELVYGPLVYVDVSSVRAGWMRGIADKPRQAEGGGGKPVEFEVVVKECSYLEYRLRTTFRDSLEFASSAMRGAGVDPDLGECRESWFTTGRRCPFSDTSLRTEPLLTPIVSFSSLRSSLSLSRRSPRRGPLLHQRPLHLPLLCDVYHIRPAHVPQLPGVPQRAEVLPREDAPRRVAVRCVVRARLGRGCVALPAGRGSGRGRLGERRDGRSDRRLQVREA